MPVLMLIAIAVVLVGIFFVATGRGGELAYEQADHAPLDLGPVSAADIALLRPPSAMWGYNMQVTDAAMDQIARAMRERDVTIAYLQDQLASAQRNGSYAQPRGAHARPLAITPPGLPALEPAGDRGALALSEGQAPLAPFEDQAPLAPFEAPEPPEAGASEELADPEPLEPLEAAGSRTAEPAAADAPGDYDTAADYDTADDYDTPGDYDARGDYEAPGDYDAPGHHDTAADDETPQAPEAPQVLETPAAETRPLEARPVEGRPLEARPLGARPVEFQPAPEVPTFTPTAAYRQTPLVLKASGPKPPPAPEPDEATQPSVISDATEEREIHDPTEPNATLSQETQEAQEAQETQETRETPAAPAEARGPQGSFDTHDWWAEQTEAAQHERARRQAAGETAPDAEEEESPHPHPHADPLAAEEQGW